MPPQRKTIIISVTLGWAIRNFYQTGILQRLQQHCDIVAIATPQAAQGLAKLGYDKLAPVRVLETGSEPLLWKLFRQAKKKIYAEGRESSTEAIWEKYRPRPAYQRIGGKVFKAVLKVLNAGRIYRLVESIDYSLNKDRRFASIFAEVKPAYFFATHATAYFDECILRNAMAAGIPQVYMILSWDHLSSKVLLHRWYSALLVWNNHTKQELLKTYPTYRAEQIHVVGIPQYDVYAEPPAYTYGDWCLKMGLDPAKRTILFSTMPQVRHNQQHIIIEALLQAIQEGSELPNDLQVMIKCHPFDSFQGYEAFLGKYPVALSKSTLPKGVKSDEWVPSGEEMTTSRDCLLFCSVNVNIFSTVTIEAAYFDKPVVHIAFDPQPVKDRIPCHEYYNWDHFKHIVEKGATVLVRDQSSLHNEIKEALLNPSKRSLERKSLVATYIGAPVGLGAEKCAEVLNGLADSMEVKIKNM